MTHCWQRLTEDLLSFSPSLLPLHPPDSLKLDEGIFWKRKKKENPKKLLWPYWKTVNSMLYLHHYITTVYLHLWLGPCWCLDTSSLAMFLGLLGVLCLSTSYPLLQVTPQGLIIPQCKSRWLATLTAWLSSSEPHPSWGFLCRFGGAVDGCPLPLGRCHNN